MFAKILLIDDEVCVLITWFGYGEMRVLNFKRQKTMRIRKDNKAHFLSVCYYLSKFGLQLDAKDQNFRSFVRQFADVMMLGQDGLLIRTVRNMGAEEHAHQIFSSEA